MRPDESMDLTQRMAIRLAPYISGGLFGGRIQRIKPINPELWKDAFGVDYVNGGESFLEIQQQNGITAEAARENYCDLGSTLFADLPARFKEAQTGVACSLYWFYSTQFSGDEKEKFKNLNLEQGYDLHIYAQRYWAFLQNSLGVIGGCFAYDKNSKEFVSAHSEVSNIGSLTYLEVETIYKRIRGLQKWVQNGMR